MKNKIDRVFSDELIDKATKITWAERFRLFFRPKKEKKIVMNEFPHFLYVVEYKEMDGKTYILDTYTEYEPHHIYNYHQR